MFKPAHRSRTMVALVATLMLVLQTLATAWAGATPSAPLDIFGNPLCITGIDHSSGTTDGQATLPDCCTFGCCQVSPLFAGNGGGAALAVPFMVKARAPSLSRRTIHVAGPDHNPGNPRAPPATA